MFLTFIRSSTVTGRFSAARVADVHSRIRTRLRSALRMVNLLVPTLCVGMQTATLRVARWTGRRPSRESRDAERPGRAFPRGAWERERAGGTRPPAPGLFDVRL